MAEEEHVMPASMTDSETICSLCYAEFLDPEDLIVHFNQVHLAESSQHCQFCPSMFSSLEHYAVHIRDEHLLSIKACKYCTKVFIDYDSYRKHQNKHQGDHRNALFCSQCVQKFSNLYDLQQHEIKSHDNNYDGVPLNDCFPLLSSCLNIKALNFIKSLGENAAYICTACVFTTPSPDEYIAHLKKKDCRSVVCNNCCNVYKDKKGLWRHYEKHKECFNYVKEEDWKKTCPKCESSVGLYTYSDHVKNCQPIKCNLCNIVLDSMEMMTHHQTTEHPMAITMTKCKFCHREFVGNTALQKHIDRNHKPEFHLYKYMCVYCNNMYFKHPKNLFGHFYSKHQDLQPYCCKICNLTFRVRKKFTIHIKMTHKSVGFVEFDERYHVFFTDKKSENLFLPRSLFSDEIPQADDAHDIEQEQNDLLNAQTDAPTDVPTDVPTDCPTDVPTDVPTDTEDSKKLLVERKPPKIRFKEQEKSKELNSISIKMELQSEGNQSELEVEKKSKTKQKKSKKVLKRIKEVNTDSDSEDEPLIQIKKKCMKSRGVISKWNTKKTDIKLGIRKRFTCNICKKYCYTFQNYNHHMSFHFKDEIKKCIKCSETFTSKTALNKHVSTAHSTSKLTETLRNLLERRKMGKNGIASELPTTEKFRRTIKKVISEPSIGVAKITEVSDNLSVKNFIETFTPEEREESAKKVNKPFELKSIVTLKQLDRKIMRSPVIKMTKFIPKPPPTTIKLSMPVRFKPVTSEKPKISIKLVQNVYMNDDSMDYGNNDDNFDFEEETQTKNPELVPEVAQEVMLETQEQKPPPMPHKILLPKLPKNYTDNDIKIAHLLPTAPFYKIVKMKDVLENKAQKTEQPFTEKKEDIKLPGGAKLVNVNPLAHLIGNMPVEKIIGPGNKNYKPKTDDFEKAIAKALLKLENQTTNRKKRTSKKKDQEEIEEVESAVEIEQ